MLEIKVIYKLTNDINFDMVNDEDEILDSVKRDRFGIDNWHNRGVAYIDILNDPPQRLMPGMLFENNNNNKTLFTEIHLTSGGVVCAVGEPKKVKEIIDEYLKEHGDNS